MNSNDDITVYYFQGNMRAFPIRCMLDCTKVKYTNKALSFEEWGKLEKPASTFEYGAMPVVVINGKAYSQSIAIYNYLGKRLGYMGSNIEEEYEIMNIMASWEDIMPKIGLPFFLTDEEAKKKALKELTEEYLPWILPVYERKFTTKTGKYMVGDKVSLADMFVAFLVSLLKNPMRKEITWAPLEKYAPKLTLWAEGLLQNEFKDHYNGSFFKESPL